MSPRWVYSTPKGNCFPRVSGDEPTVTYITDTNAEFSPRERG